MRQPIISIPGEDINAVARADVVCNLSSEALVVHEEEVDLLDIVYQELLQSIRKKMAGLHR